MVLTTGGKPSPPKSTSESANTGRAKWVFGGGAAVEDVRKANTHHVHESHEERRIREAEKAEKIMHIICWGPTPK